MAVEPDLNLLAAQIARRFIACGPEGKGVVILHLAILFDKEQFVVGFAGRQKANPAEVEPEAVKCA